MPFDNGDAPKRVKREKKPVHDKLHMPEWSASGTCWCMCRKCWLPMAIGGTCICANCPCGGWRLFEFRTGAFTATGLQGRKIEA